MSAFAYSPQAKFSFNRAYLEGFFVPWNPDTDTYWTDNVMFYIAPFYGTNGYITIRPNVWEWSSNTYTLDYVVESCTINFPPSPDYNELPYSLGWELSPDKRIPYITLHPYGVSGTGGVRHSFPHAPPGYWFPGYDL